MNKTNKINKNTAKGEAMLITAAVLWGSCFLFQKKGMDYIGPFTLGTFRFFMGAAALLPMLAVMSAMKRKRIDKEPVQTESKNGGAWIKYGIICGLLLFPAASLQQIGLVYTDSGKAGFLTSLELIAVVVLSVIRTRRLGINVLIGTVLAMAGVYMLSVTEGLTIGHGDLYVIISTVFWGLQITAVDKYAKLCDPIRLSFAEFLTCGILSAVCMAVGESPELNNILQCAVPILYTAVIEVAVCYTLQTAGQKYVNPVVSGITMSMESVFAAVFGVIFLHEALNSRELAGCAVMLAAIIIAQLPGKYIGKRN